MTGEMSAGQNFYALALLRAYERPVKTFLLFRYLICLYTTLECFYWQPSFTGDPVPAPSLPVQYGFSIVGMREAGEVYLAGAFHPPSSGPTDEVFRLKDEVWSAVRT